jgi:hypothetical protein
MSAAIPMIRVHMAASQMQEALSRLTAYLLEEQYAFLHTFHSGEHTELEIFQQSGAAVVHLTIQTGASTRPTGHETAATDEQSQSGESARLIQRLLDICNS